MWANSSRNRKKRVDGTLGPVVVSFRCSLCQSLFPLGSITAYTNSSALPDTNIIPLRCAEASSSGHGACLTSRFFLFHRGGKHFLARLCSKINTRLTAIWCTALEILRWQIPPTAWAPSPSKQSRRRLQQSVRAWPGPTSDQRPQTKPGRLDQTNDHACV